jgi:hypothetical protein
MNHKKPLVFLLLIIFVSVTIKPQSLKLGFRIEPTIMITEQNNSSSIAFSPYAMYLTAIVMPVDGLSFEVRPGYFLGGEYYGGFEFGAFARWMIWQSRFYLIGGINNHSNSWLGSHNGGSGLSKNILYKGIGIGFQNDSKLDIDLMYYFTNDKDFAYLSIYNPHGYSRFENKKMNGILKLGFSLAWDIL